MIGPEPDPRAWRGFHLLDLSALVVGYGLASVLVRAFWPSAGAETTAVLAVIGLVYLWLGLAMSGPLVLARRRREVAGEVPYSSAELAWLIIGFYWIAMMVLMVPGRPRGAPLDGGLLGVVPLVAALLLRFLSPLRHGTLGTARWTHRAAVLLLATWPVAWAALIALGKNLL